MSEIKFNLSDQCLYCGVKLPPNEERTGDGEHIIPKNIFGFLKSRDVCEECMQYFGKEVDNLTLNNFEIINAVKELGLDLNKTFTDNIRYKGKDLYNDEEVEFKPKKGKITIKGKQTEDFFQIREELFNSVGNEWIKKGLRKHLSEKEMNKELIILKDNYKNAQYGDIIRSEILKLEVRKTTAKTTGIDTSKFKNLSPLIAKIAVFFLRYSLSDIEIKKIINFEDIRKHSRFGKKLKDMTIYFSPRKKEKHYYKYHLLSLQFFDNILILDVSLFGYPNWVIVIDASEKICQKYPDENNKEREINVMNLELDFENLNVRKLTIGYRFSDDGTFINYQEIL